MFLEQGVLKKVLACLQAVSDNSTPEQILEAKEGRKEAFRSFQPSRAVSDVPETPAVSRY